jgi:ribosomal protein L11 methyltransferase
MMRLACDEPTAQSLSNLLLETFDENETAVSVFEVEPNAAAWVSKDWMVEVFFESEPDPVALRDLVANALGAEVAARLEFGHVEQRDWVAAALEGLAPVRVGRFVVHGAHDRDAVKPHEIGLEIPAALAFGTGHHGTTRGCLTMLVQVLKQRRPRSVLDVGTGTGVLALAAAKALRQFVASGDIDPVSVEAALGNAALNGARPWLKPVTAVGVRHPALFKPAAYDLIFANILAKPLRLLAPSLARVASQDAELILSGLLASDVAGVLSAYAAQGFHLKRRIMLEGWVTLLLARGGAAARHFYF